MTDRRLVPPPKPVREVASPPPVSAHHLPGRVACWIDYGVMWVQLQAGGTEATAAMTLEQAERHLENVKACIATLRGGGRSPLPDPMAGEAGAPKPTSDAARAALAVEGDR